MKENIMNQFQLITAQRAQHEPQVRECNLNKE
jgi:hypothetical protein